MPHVGFEAFDGARQGPTARRIKITVKSPTAVSYLAQAPGALGLARAYVSGHLDVAGDMYAALARMAQRAAIAGQPARAAQAAAQLGGPKLLAAAGAAAAAGGPGQQPVAAGRRHSKQRDASAISHHYDVSNTFYEWVLGPSMAYTCACYPSDGRDAGAGAGSQVRPRRAQARADSRGCGCSTSAAAGAAW